MKTKDILKARERASALLERAGIVITAREKEAIEVADFGLGDHERVGFEIVVYINTDRYCAKEIVLLPRQMCPEHRHPAVEGGKPGKQETFRCRWGEVFLYTEGRPAPSPKAVVPEAHRTYLTVWNEIVLRPGDQHTLPPDTLHWFQAGDEGAVVSEFSSTSRDETDIWTDPRIDRIPREE